MVYSLEAQLKDLRGEESDILRKIDEKNKRKRISCESCDKSHPIQSLTLIQTYWYTSPHGCTGGDYWSKGEMEFICPETKVVNRILFNNYDVPWEKRDEYGNDPEEQFRRNYGELFKEILESHDDSGNLTRYKNEDGEYIESHEITNGQRVNNYYVDHNRKKFGLVEKRKE